VTRQEVILNEMAARVRRYKGLSQSARHRRPLVMILAKADIWLPPEDLAHEPMTADASPRLDTVKIRRMSDRCRALMEQTCPEIVSAAEGFSQKVIYVPVSSLGTSPELVEQGGVSFYGIRPSRIRPRWVTVPLLWGLAQGVPNLVPTNDPPSAAAATTSGGSRA
jgi:hypothetical protein